jgi:hypothetical protein
MSVDRHWWHVVWTTFLARSPADVRGDWAELSQAYSDIFRASALVRTSAPLDVRWQGRPEEARALLLSPLAREVAERTIAELAESDRVAGDTEIRALAIQPNAVQMVLACRTEVLHQRVGRFKSRSATVLSFDPATNIVGKGTWSREFWWASLPDEATATMAAEFVSRVASAGCRPSARG